MTRQEFTEQLRIALQGTIPQKRLNEHLRYYDNYIMEEARKGRTEEQVVADLGDPRLIAKTISVTDAAQRAEGTYHHSRDSGGYQSRGSDGYRSRDTGGYQGRQGDGFEERSLKKGGFWWNTWYGKLALIAVAVLIVVVIAQVVAFLLPIVIPVVLILVLLSFVLGRR